MTEEQFEILELGINKLKYVEFDAKEGRSSKLPDVVLFLTSQKCS